MSDPDMELLVNCTVLAVQRFDLHAFANTTLIYNYNRTNVLHLLSDIIENKDNLENVDNAKDFLTECLFPSPTRPYELPWEQKTIWAIVFGLMLLVAIAGNSIVLWIVTGHRSMRTVTNYFLLNLSIADLLMSSLNCVFNFIFMLNSDWPFGSVYCTINNFMANVTVSTSVFTLVAITFDRYIAIVHPLKRRTSRRKVRFILVLIWVLSCLLSAPCLLYSNTATKRNKLKEYKYLYSITNGNYWPPPVLQFCVATLYYNGKSRTVCFMLWPDGRYPTSISDYVYNIIILVLTYGIPMIVMLICYTLMGRVLWGSRSIGENTDRQIESMKSKRKVVRMFIAIVLIFAICWLPYHLFFIYAYHNNQMTTTKYVQHLYLGFYWLAMSNAMVNPIIYYWMNKRFRIYFQRVIFCGLTRQKFDSPKSQLTNKNSSHRQTKADHKNNYWKRSTMETQIHQVPITLTQHKQPNKSLSATTANRLNFTNFECVMKRPLAKQHNSLPIVKAKTSEDRSYISCDEDNNAILESSKHAKHNNQFNRSHTIDQL